MEQHRWEIELAHDRNVGEAQSNLKTGEDGMPPLDMVDIAESLVLTLPGVNARFRVEVPPGKRLVFFRRNQILMAGDGRSLGKLHVYFIGWKSREIDPKQKCVQMIHVSPTGEVLSVLLDKDGRSD